MNSITGLIGTVLVMTAMIAVFIWAMKSDFPTKVEAMVFSGVLAVVAAGEVVASI